MSKVLLGSATIDERGRASGGKAGNQTGKELKIQNYYLHSKGWYRLRCLDYNTRMRIADCMRKAVNNRNIGYDQNQRLSLYNEVKKYGFDCSKVSIPVETDCSALVRVCLAYAGINVGNFTTLNERNVLMATNKFSCQAITKESELMEGDILVTKSKGHTVVVVQGYKSEPVPTDPADAIAIIYTIQKGDTLSGIAKKYKTTIQELQRLNPTIIKDVNKIGVGWKIKVK